MVYSSEKEPKITVYIPSYNYGRYVKQAIESIIDQTYTNWEMIVIDDGSKDNTKEILKEYEGHHKIRILYQENIGLTKTNNKVVQISRGKYIMRLDADDYLDENALLVMANILDQKPEVGLVYPDYYIVSEDGDLIRLERRKTIGKEVNLLDIPAHGACTMIRKSCLQELGGYNESYQCQDGYDLWIRFIEKFGVYNINLPLFYYRRHSSSLTSNLDRILDTRKRIKRNFVKHNRKDKFKVLGIIPASSSPPPFSPMGVLFPIADKPMIDYSISASIDSEALDKIVVTSDSETVLEYVKKNYSTVDIIPRDRELARPHTHIEPTIIFVLNKLRAEYAYEPDAVMILFANAPLRKPAHIQKAIDTLIIFSCDSVVSVTVDDRTFYRHTVNGLEPLVKHRKLRLEKDVMYAENGGILLSRLGVINGKSFIGETVGHIEMLPEESFQVDSEFYLSLIDKILSEREKISEDSISENR